MGEQHLSVNFGSYVLWVILLKCKYQKHCCQVWKTLIAMWNSLSQNMMSKSA